MAEKSVHGECVSVSVTGHHDASTSRQNWQISQEEPCLKGTTYSSLLRFFLIAEQHHASAPVFTHKQHAACILVRSVCSEPNCCTNVIYAHAQQAYFILHTYNQCIMFRILDPVLTSAHSPIL